MTTRTVAPDEIDVGQRFRKDVGDLDGLADSIRELGLLHPVVVTPDLRLIAGFRRLQACKRLGWKKVPVRLLDLQRVVAGEFAENVFRKDFTLSEIAAIAKELRPHVETQARQRRESGLKQRWNKTSEVENCHDRQPGKTRDIIARYVGLSGRSLDKIEAIARAAEENPARYGHLKEEMDRGTKAMGLNRLYLQLRHLQEAEAARHHAPVVDGEVQLHHCDFRQLEYHVRHGSARLVIVDPPWGKDALDLWPDVAKCAQTTLMEGGVLAVLTPLMYLPQVVAALGDRLQYRWTMALFRGDPCPLVMSQQVMNGWRPVLLYSKGECGQLRIRDALSYSRAAWKKKYHPWEQNPEEIRYLVEHLTETGDVVVDFFGGSFGAAVVCQQTHRQYRGCDTDEGCVNIGRRRLHEGDQMDGKPACEPPPSPAV
jgi:ParB-like chromosome segregation protein Spo0J